MYLGYLGYAGLARAVLDVQVLSSAQVLRLEMRDAVQGARPSVRL